MKKLVIYGVIFASLIGVAFAGTGTLSNVNSVQTIAPNGKKDVTLTVNSQTVDMRGDAQWAVYATAACKFRTMSTATKAGTARTIPITTWLERGVNPATPFINFTGCTGGELQRH